MLNWFYTKILTHLADTKPQSSAGQIGGGYIERGDTHNCEDGQKNTNFTKKLSLR